MARLELVTLRPVFGHEPLLDRLVGGLASGRFPQAALLTGPTGVGKQRIALWIAQALLCDEPKGGKPCVACQSCRLAVGLTHPDLHWFVPIPRPKATEADKQIEEAAEALGEVMASRRENPFYDRPDGMASHALASIRLLQRRVALTPFRSRRKVVLVGDAERLVVQEASQEAANALLKVLEEPPADTVIMLTASEPQALLPTIRSRLVPIRVPRVPDAVVRGFLTREMSPPVSGAELERRVAAAEGCIGRTLGGEGDTTTADRDAGRLLEAAKAGPAGWSARALQQGTWAARGDFTAMLDALALRLRSGVRQGTAGTKVRGWARALARVEEIRSEAQGNVNPQLALAVLAGDLERWL
jgi:DNA polymerase-3 subunit delta'